MKKETFKGIGAILAGFITVFVLSVVTDLILEKSVSFHLQLNLRPTPGGCC